MLKKAKIYSFFICFISFSVVSFSVEEITIATGEWPPYTSQTLAGLGHTTTIVTRAFAAMGVGVTYQWKPWKRSYILAENLKVDATMPWWSTAERREKFIYSDPIDSSKTVIWYQKNKPIHFSSVQDLKGLKIGGVIGFSYGSEFDQAVKNKLFIYEKTRSVLVTLRKLAAGRLDAFPCSLDVCLSHLKTGSGKSFANEVTYASTPLTERQLYLIVSKKHPNGEQIIKTFNKGLSLIGEEKN
ncbi:substrate-binding periplasmic protein [Piscirickettsia litoralis]|nr:transporter substrate-binding domain-containing protein [Piscirickettsia litoralis]